jgi:hypothetical protein
MLVELLMLNELHFPKYEALQHYLDSVGFLCYPRELELKGEKHPFVDLAAHRQDAFWAFEYKSFADSLERGIEQCKGYARWFNYVTIVLERRLTSKSKYYTICKRLGFAILLREFGGIDGTWAWKLDPKQQNPSSGKIDFVRGKFASEPSFLQYLGTLRFGVTPESDDLNEAAQEKASTLVPNIAHLLLQQTLNLFISVWHTGSFVEPRKCWLIVFSKTQLSGAGYVGTDELRCWIKRPEIVWIIHYPGDDRRWEDAEPKINGRICTVAEVIAEKTPMAYNIVRDLRYCESRPNLHSKSKEIGEALKHVRGRYAEIS